MTPTNGSTITEVTILEAIKSADGNPMCPKEGCETVMSDESGFDGETATCEECGTIYEVDSSAFNL